jgi:hypothetical protein
MTTALTRLPFLAAVRVAENRVGLVDKLEALFSMTVIAVQVGMPAPGLTPKRQLQSLWSSTRLQTEQ